MNWNFMKSTPDETTAPLANVTEAAWLELVRRQVGSLNFGVVQIVVHASRVVQIERTEKLRFADPAAVSIRAD
jgi:hypothetical protein